MKLGRNDKCPCGSGKKYKRCCANKPKRADGPKPAEKDQKNEKVTLKGAIEAVQTFAADKKETLQELGVFLFYADKVGDAWLLEITDSDCIQIASGGEILEVPLEENNDTIIVDWSHSFAFKHKQLRIISHKGKEQRILENAPSLQLFAAVKRILRRFSAELLDQVHISK
jgi:hypothetical protein